MHLAVVVGCNGSVARSVYPILARRPSRGQRWYVFTAQPIHEIAYDLAFSDPSHFALFQEADRHHAA